MIAPAACREIVQTYEKHGWILRRVLLSDASRASLGPRTGEVFGRAPVTAGEVDAAWFSRPPGDGDIAWEIRHLSETPFALLEFVDENSGDFEERLSEIESRLAKHIIAKRNLDNASTEQQT